MNEHKQGEMVRHAVDMSLSGLRGDPWLAQRILANAKGEVKVKKKMSLAMVIAVVLILATVTALAVATLRETAQFIAQTERESGYFGAWPAEKKVEVLKALVEEGYIEKDAQIQRLMDHEIADEEAGQVADAAIKALTGEDAANIGFLSIMNAVWGPFEKWSYEEKAWYSQLMKTVGIESDGKTVFMEPQGSVDEEKAVMIARKSIAKGYGVEESQLDHYTLAVTFQVPESAEPGDAQPYWAIAYTAPDSLAKEKRPFNHIQVFVHPATGQLLRTVEEMLADRDNLPVRPTTELYQAIDAYYVRAMTEGLHSFADWPLELRAEYSREITPKVKALLEKDDLTTLLNNGALDITVVAQSAYLYGLPGDRDITQDKAFSLAKEALQEAYQLDAELFSLYGKINVYFDVTNPEMPLWKFFLNPNNLPWQYRVAEMGESTRNLCYKAEIDARTGKTIRVDEFVFESLGRDLDYMLKWY